MLRRISSVKNVGMNHVGPFGPLHSCVDLGANGEFNARWGVTTAVGNADISTNHDSKHDSGVPYAHDSRDSHIYEDPNGTPGNSDLFDAWYANWSKIDRS